MILSYFTHCSPEFRFYCNSWARFHPRFKAKPWILAILGSENAPFWHISPAPEVPLYGRRHAAVQFATNQRSASPTLPPPSGATILPQAHVTARNQSGPSTAESFLLTCKTGGGLGSPQICPVSPAITPIRYHKGT